MLANRGDKRFSVAREVRVAPRDNTHLHVLFNFKGNRDDVFAVELVRDHARAHGVAIEAYEQVEQGRSRTRMFLSRPSVESGSSEK